MQKKYLNSLLRLELQSSCFLCEFVISYCEERKKIPHCAFVLLGSLFPALSLESTWSQMHLHQQRACFDVGANRKSISSQGKW